MRQRGRREKKGDSWWTTDLYWTSKDQMGVELIHKSDDEPGRSSRVSFRKVRMNC